jgi:hypothetical protein
MIACCPAAQRLNLRPWQDAARIKFPAAHFNPLHCNLARPDLFRPAQLGAFNAEAEAGATAMSKG